MKDFRTGYLYSLAPIHCGGEGDLGNILEIAREIHTNFPYIPGSSLRGSLRDEMEVLDTDATNALFGKELDDKGQMGVHQVWFGDARLLWVPMKTMSQNNTDVFTWVSCPSLLCAHAIATGKGFASFPDHAVGLRAGRYTVADAQINVSEVSPEQQQAIALSGNFPNSLKDPVQPTWEKNRIVLPDADFEILMEHALWTQIRNKIQEAGAAEVFWTDVCIPRDTILYFNWGYSLDQKNPATESQHKLLMSVLQGLIQVGGQANVGRGWVQSWVNNNNFVSSLSHQPSTAGV
jgi:CRISPR-associated protein Cmr4